MAKLIAFQGEPGAFSHAASHALFPRGKPVPCATFEDTIQAVKTGKADYGVVPVENSLYGRITDIYHLLPESGLFIVGEHFLRIEMNLLGVKGATLADIKSVQSLNVALGQCRKFIRKHRLKTIAGGDTAGSAREIAERNDKSVAAIASRFAAEVYGLDILAENIEDAAHNTTRFLVISKAPDIPRRGKTAVKTTFVFRVRNVPAALYKAMGGFATNGVNMTKLESYQLGAFTATLFYADIEGHPDDPGVKNALEELRFFSKEVRILGVYRRSDSREEWKVAD